jgi:hypothetical protein
MDATPIIAAVQGELRKHQWDTFVNDARLVRDVGHGVLVPGCPSCRKRLSTMGISSITSRLMSCRR